MNTLIKFFMYSLKFGGTSMGSAENILQAADIIITHPEQEKVVTVSAMSGITDILLTAAKCATKEDEGCYASLMHDVRDKHLEALNGLVSNEELYKEGEVFIIDRVKSLQEFLAAISIVGELTPRSHDAIISVGEILSAFLLSLALRDKGKKSEFINLENSIISDNKNPNSEFFAQFAKTLHSTLSPLLEKGITPVCTGFFGRIPGGIINGVGRGYSDFTAALIGNACNAEEIQIWTDVSGILSADPRVVSSAHTLEELSFDEATELANFGAKVIHPQTIWPAVKNNIVVRIKNTMAPLENGTIITKKGKQCEFPIKSVTAKKGITVLTMISSDMTGHGMMSKIFGILAKHKVSIDMIATSEASISVTIESGGKYLENAKKELSLFCKVVQEDENAIVAVVGCEMRTKRGVAEKFCSAFRKEDINIRMITQGASEMNISAVIAEGEVKKALTSLHSIFFV